MSRAQSRRQGHSANDHALAHLAAARRAGTPLDAADLAAEVRAELIASDLAACSADGQIVPTAAGEARLRRLAAAKVRAPLDPFRAQHSPLRGGAAAGDPAVSREAVINEAESPLAWLARRKGRAGEPLIAPAQFLAGERLRTDFTLAQLTPRMTVDWASPLARSAAAAGGGPATLADTVVAARQRLTHALDAAGPEFAGLLMDVCCFLKGLEDIERERGWPQRSGKVVLQLGLDRLARHYGLAGEARGHRQTRVRTWRAAAAHFTSGPDDVAVD